MGTGAGGQAGKPSWAEDRDYVFQEGEEVDQEQCHSRLPVSVGPADRRQLSEYKP